MRLLMLAFLVAQTVATTIAYDVWVYRTGDPPAGPPFKMTTIPADRLRCDLAPTVAPAAPAILNPTRILFADRDHVGKVCALDVGTFFLGLPVGRAYVAYTIPLTGAGPGPRGQPGPPFDIVAVPPPALEGLGVR